MPINKERKSFGCSRSRQSRDLPVDSKYLVIWRPIKINDTRSGAKKERERKFFGKLRHFKERAVVCKASASGYVSLGLCCWLVIFLSKLKSHDIYKKMTNQEQIKSSTDFCFLINLIADLQKTNLALIIFNCYLYNNS